MEEDEFNIIDMTNFFNELEIWNSGYTSHQDFLKMEKENKKKLIKPKIKITDQKPFDLFDVNN